MNRLGFPRSKGVILYYDALIEYLRGNTGVSKGIIDYELDFAIENKHSWPISGEELNKLRKDLSSRDYSKIEWISKLKKRIRMKYDRSFK